MTNDDLMAKIGKMLHLAENASTPEEADAFMKKAQMLGTQYSIDLAMARSVVAKGMKRETPMTKAVTVAEYNSKTKKFMVELFSTIGQVNDLVSDISHSSTIMYPYGFKSDIELTEALFASLSVQMVDRANAWLATGEYKNEMERRWDNKTWQWIEKPIDGRVARASFYRSFISEVGRRLRDAKNEAEKQIKEAASDGGTGTELVLVAKNEEVGSYYRSKSNARGSWKGSSAGTNSSSGRSAGREAGQRANLGGNKSISGSRKAVGA